GPGHAAEEVERLITVPLEKELNGIAGITFLRSVANVGLSNIHVLFADGTDNYWSRQQVLERITGAELPPDAKPGLGPMANEISEVHREPGVSQQLPHVEEQAPQDTLIE